MANAPDRLVKINWVDASDPPDQASWYTEEEIADFAAVKVEVVSVGYVKSDTKLYLTLVADYILNADGTITYGRPTKIPRDMCLSIEPLTVTLSS